MTGKEAGTSAAASTVERLSAAARIECGSEEAGRRTIRGVANTFRLMRSGRLIHPAAIEKWLASRDAERPIPLLAQHGFAPGFSQIGRITKLAVDRNLGLAFEAMLAEGIALADDAWTMIRQGMAPAVSIGWYGQARWVRDDEPEIDEWVKEQLARVGAHEAQVFFTVTDLAEISLVDVPDDADARLAARGQPRHGAAAQVEQLRGEVAALRGAIERMQTAGGPAGAAMIETLRGAMDEFLEEFKSAALDAIENDPSIGEAAELAALAGDAESCASAARAERPPMFASARAAVARWVAKS